MRSIPCFFGALVLSFCWQGSANAEYVTLEQTWVEAYQNNPALEAERAKLRATDEQVSLALSRWRPTIEAASGVGKTYQRIPSQKIYGTDNFAANTTTYNVQVTQPIFRGFRTLNETEAAKKQVMAGRAVLQAAEQKLLLDTATAFLDVVRDELLLKADRDNEAVLRKKLEETVVRARHGDLTQTDVQQAESRVARAEVTRLQTENALQVGRAAFARLVGHEPMSLANPKIDSDNSATIDSIVRAAMAQNPAVIAARHTLEQSDAETAFNKGSLLPELNLVGSSSRNFGQSSTIPGRQDSSQIMLQLKIPLYQAGADHARIRAAQQTGIQRRMELEDARRSAQELARNAWQSFLMADAAIKADDRQIDAATRALEGVRVQAQVGTRTTLDELNAEQELLDAKKDRARSEHDRNLALLQVKSAIGKLTADALKLPLEAYDPKRHYDDNHAAWIGFGGADDDVYAKSQLQNRE